MNEIYLIINDTDWLNISLNVNSWKEYIKSNPSITKAELCFRSHRENLTISDGLYIARGGFGFVPATGNDEAVFFGYRSGDMLIRQIWKIPELLIIDTIEQDINSFLELENYYGITVKV